MSNLSRKLMMGAAGAGDDVLGVEDVFSTWLYTGNGSTQTITNGIDLSGEGGLVWIKSRSLGTSHVLTDTARGSSSQLYSDRTNAQGTVSDQVTAFTGSGFSLGTDTLGTGTVNASATTYASWTFRKAPKFFDVVTWTGTGADQTISHNLGSTPGCIIVKQTSGAGEWYVYHRSLSTPSENFLRLYNTGAANGAIGQDVWGPPTSTTFKADTYLGHSTSSATYVAYLFAHDAGGFGDAGTDSVVSCGTFNDASAGSVNLGWEPQFVITKFVNTSGNWSIFDSMRGWPVAGNAQLLNANLFGAESGTGYIRPTATGFTYPSFGGLGNVIYIAIRRGPMKTPTDATEVFDVDAYAGGGVTRSITTGFASDLAWFGPRYGASSLLVPKLTGNGRGLYSALTNAEDDFKATYGTTVTLENEAIITYGTATSSSTVNSPGVTYTCFNFRRAPGFFDVVAWTASASTSITHGLGVTPELIIAKSRSVAGEYWTVYTQPGGRGNVLFLNTTNSNVGIADYWGTSGPTATTFGVAASGSSNNAGNMIAYLFATCPGVSKVGSYTGTGTTLNVDCGFTAGARFVLIKRTDSSGGDWYVWDTARGIIPGNDPYLLLNSTAAEVTNTDYIDPLSSGFQITSTAPAAINASGGSYIFLAIA